MLTCNHQCDPPFLFGCKNHRHSCWKEWVCYCVFTFLYPCFVHSFVIKKWNWYTATKGHLFHHRISHNPGKIIIWKGNTMPKLYSGNKRCEDVQHTHRNKILIKLVPITRLKGRCYCILARAAHSKEGNHTTHAWDCTTHCQQLSLWSSEGSATGTA